MEGKLPLYKIVINEEDDNTGVNMISMVEYPAIESDFMLFNKHTSFNFKSDNYKQILTGAALIPNKEIYREDKKGNGFNVMFEEETIRQIVDKFFKNGYTNNINLHHEFPTEGNYVIESWIIEDFDTDKAKLLGFERLPKGTWMVSLKVSDKDFWDKKILTGEVKGFSVEIEADIQEKFNIVGKDLLLRIFKTASGAVVKVQENTENVFYIDEFENIISQLVDGEYELENGDILIVSNSKFQEVIELNKELDEIEELFESFIFAEPNAKRIWNVMDEKRVVKIYYQGSYDGNVTEKAGFRSIEIFTYGITYRGNRAIRAWQRGGSSDSGITEGWKIFLTQKISSFDNTIQTYSGVRPGYRKGDSAFTTIFREL